MSFYRFARAVVLSLCKVVFRVRVVGKENVPADRRVHRRAVAPLDPRRPVRRVTSPSAPSASSPRTSCSPTASASASSTRSARSRSSAAPPIAPRCAPSKPSSARGEPVAVFPEGTREAGPRLGDLFDGAAYLAVKLGVPIVPVGIGGSEHILPEGQVLPASAPRRGRGGEADRAAGARRTRPPRRGHQITDELAAELQRAFTEALRIAG